MSSGGRPSFALNGNDLGFCFFSLKSQELTSQVARQLWEFDNNDSHAIDAVQAHVAELEKGSVFVAYNHLQQDVYLIYVVQLLAKVPFAVLQDSTSTHNDKYPDQRHTISLIPSLRAFKRCNDRIRSLQKLDPHVG
uniref:Uncharacterized protein n=1 Tax=Physcomitrium patens TaxID=3218 RepID=A0A2K1KLU5_PHYPA|nr:hypothetical protein PHYPA_005634 [Physcomitrium patens]